MRTKHKMHRKKNIIRVKMREINKHVASKEKEKNMNAGGGAVVLWGVQKIKGEKEDRGGAGWALV